MSDTYAQIQNGTVINVVLASSSADFDPNFNWIDITNISPTPGIGWTYNGSFTSPVPAITLSQAQAQNIAEFEAALQALVTNSYALETRWNLLSIYISAMNAGNLPNRMAYIAQLFAWSNSCISYASTYIANIMALTDVPTVQSTTWDFTQIVANPNVTAQGALAIAN